MANTEQLERLRQEAKNKAIEFNLQIVKLTAQRDAADEWRYCLEKAIDEQQDDSELERLEEANEKLRYDCTLLAKEVESLRERVEHLQQIESKPTEEDGLTCDRCNTPLQSTLTIPLKGGATTKPPPRTLTEEYERVYSGLKNRTAAPAGVRLDWELCPRCDRLRDDCNCVEAFTAQIEITRQMLEGRFLGHGARKRAEQELRRLQNGLNVARTWKETIPKLHRAGLHDLSDIEGPPWPGQRQADVARRNALLLDRNDSLTEDKIREALKQGQAAADELSKQHRRCLPGPGGVPQISYCAPDIIVSEGMPKGAGMLVSPTGEPLVFIKNIGEGDNQ